MLDRFTYDTRKLRNGSWECRCPQLPTVRAVHADRAEAISRCVREAFVRAAEIDEARRFGVPE